MAEPASSALRGLPFLRLLTPAFGQVIRDPEAREGKRRREQQRDIARDAGS